jgi:DNA-3-methyladenine glycosylase
MKALPRSFFERHPSVVAREILGQKLIREFDGQLISGIVIETEAYLGTKDSASHAFKGKTPRNQVMFGPAGISYVYFVYGMHYLLNVVTGKEHIPEAVLFRALIPLQGQDLMLSLRRKKSKDLTNGPAKLCQALAIDKSLNAWDLTLGQKLWLENYKTVPDRFIRTGPRIGIHYATTQDRNAPWRFWINSSHFKDI